MNQANLLRQFRLRVGQPTVDQVTDEQLLGFLQRGLEAINRRAEVTWADDTSLTTVINTQEYALPIAVVRVEWVEIGGAFLKKQSMEEYRKRYIAWRTDAASTPTEYVIYDRKLLLYPKPSAASAVTMRVVTTPADIPTGGVTDLPAQDHPVVLYYAAAEYHASMGDPGRSGAFLNLFAAEAKLLADQMERREIKK